MDPILLKTIAELDEFTRNQLLALNKDLAKAYEKYARGEQIANKDEYLSDMFKAIAAWGALFAAGLITYNVLAANRSLDRNNKLLKDEFGKYANNDRSFRELDRDKARTVNLIGDTFMGRKFRGTDISNEQRIKTIIDGAQRTVRNIVNVGIDEGKPSWEIAKQIEIYIRPDVKDGKRVAPWTIARRELGKPTSYIPKGVPAGSVEYNAMRIARTETAKTYQAAPYLAHKDKWYYDGIIWHLSRSHPEPDICDEYAAHDEGIGKGVWIVLPEIPHPHCLCWTAVKTVSPAEMIEMFNKLNW